MERVPGTTGTLHFGFRLFLLMFRIETRGSGITMTISAKDVKTLRDRTAAGMMDCKRALEETEGDMEAAIDLLRSRGAAKAAKRADKAANEGTIGSYVHFGGRIAVIVELNCETDFVANTDDFQQLAKDIAMHVAAANPLAVSAEEIPEDVVERERQVYLEQVRNEGKPEAIQEKIVDGKMRKFFEETTLLKQPFVKDPDRTVEQLITDTAAKTGEKINVARFARFEVGAEA
jgi:elongation factor Ts